MKILVDLIKQAKEKGQREIRLDIELAEQIEAELARRPKGEATFRTTKA